MDIRKYLKKSDSKRAAGKRTSAASANGPSSSSASRAATRRSPAAAPPRKSPSKKPQPADADYEPEEDDEDDFQPKRKRRSSARSSAAAAEVVDVDDDVVAVADRPSRKRSRASSVRADAPEPSDPAVASGPAFGGPDAALRDDDGAAQPPAKKKRWVPRSDAPPNRGNKPLPVGAPNCLAGKVFVITGVLDSLLREECQDLVKEYGARVVGSVSKKVTHGIIGTEPGESKMAKLKTNRVPLIDEDQLFEMINRTNKAKKKEEEVVEEVKEEPMEVDRPGRKSASVRGKGSKQEPADTHPRGSGNATLWVDKYRPAQSSELVANPKAVKDLKMWLESWKSKFLHGRAHQWKLKDRGEKDYAAVLLVGPPGIGKTTAAHVVCRELGFEPHEFNASDVRNKGGVQMLAETVMVANTLSKYLKIKPGPADTTGKKAKDIARSYRHGQVLIMDEVDGMSSGDRGGGQELIKMIKTSRVPIICIANDDSTPNMRSLSGNCFKIRFRRPMVTQVSKRLLEIARREGFRQMQDQTLNKLAEGCHGDIRQMINMLQTWRCASASLSFGQVKQRLEVEGKTVMQRSIFDLSRGFFTPGPDGSVNSLMSRMDNFFGDSDLMPLFIHENYASTVAADNTLESLADAAESISEGDLCNSLVRREQRWELMPAGAILSSIRPGSIMKGGLRQQAQFPSYLGNLSKGNKWRRIVQGLEMKVKAVKTSTGSVRAFRLDYIPALTTCLATPLIRSGADGVEEVVERLDSYYLEKDPDWLEVLEAGVYAKGRSPLENIRPAAKTALTRGYNAGEHRRSTVTGVRIGVKQTAADSGMSKKKVGGGEDVAVVDDDPMESEEKDEKDEDDEGVEEVMAEFGKKKRGAKGGRGRGRGRGSASSGRGRGRGRGKRGRGRK